MVRLSILFVVLQFVSFFSHAQLKKEQRTNVLTPALHKLLDEKTPASINVVVVLKNKAAFSFPVTVTAHHKETNTYQVQLSKHQLVALINEDKIAFADVAVLPKEELTTGVLDLATNKTTAAHHRHPAITGDSILVSIKENSFDTLDIDLTQRIKKSPSASPLITAHAAIMATTVGGAGNSSPQAKGVAPDSWLTSANFSSLLPEPDSLYQAHQISIQNHSYGTAVQNYYGAEARAFDQSAINNPALMFVFSAGNSGSATTGTYAADFGNLTGNFKMSKNSITVGATDSFYTMAALSSKGPAYDGRIKPEVVAFGEDGSSGAAAMVSGAAALVQQAYKIGHNKTLPPSELVKAILINSADDVGASGPEYTSGYGSLNVLNAVETVTENRFEKNNISPGDAKEFSITVPAGAAGLKLTLCWNDLPAPLNATKALQHNLDGFIKTPSGTLIQPWILNVAKHRDSLLLPAKRGNDTVNNVEQIWIENPIAGIYTFVVNGTNLTAAQSYAFAYDVVLKDAFEWTFPTASDPLPSAETVVIRWQTTRKGTGTLQYFNDKQTWTNIADDVAVEDGFFKWTTPNIAATALLRINFSDGATTVSDSFVISPRLQIKTGFDCTDSTLVYWNTAPAAQYQLYYLQGKTLQPLQLTADTMVTLNSKHLERPYLSVAPVINGKTGMRSATLNFKSNGVGCYFSSFYLQTQTSNSAVFAVALGTSYGIKSIGFQKFKNGIYFNLNTVAAPVLTNFNFTDTTLQKGVNQYRLQLTLNSGAVVYSDVITVYHFSESNVIIFPNPAKQNEPIQLLTNKAGRTNLIIYNAAGVKIKELFLSNLQQPFSTFTLSKGIYFVTIVTDEGYRETQKILVQ